MPRYIIERNIPEAGKLSPEELQAISHRAIAPASHAGRLEAQRRCFRVKYQRFRRPSAQSTPGA